MFEIKTSDNRFAFVYFANNKEEIDDVVIDQSKMGVIEYGVVLRGWQNAVEVHSDHYRHAG